MCTKQDQEKEQGNGIELHVSHTITISAVVSGRLGAMSRMEGFFSSSMNCMSMDSIIEVFYHLNKMLIATKHIADNNDVFQ